MAEGQVDERWLSILEQCFPDGYILNDLLCQFQAAAHWQERYGEECPLQGEAIDAAMAAVGEVRGERAFVKSEAHGRLISDICDEIAAILDHYTAVYCSQVYLRHRAELAAISVYTEAVMTQQLLTVADGRFYASEQLFARRGQYASVILDARKLLRERGGALSIDEMAEALWFIPRDTLLNCLSRDTEALNMGDGRWMLAANFPVTASDAARIGALLDEHFLSSSYLRAGELRKFLARHLPAIEENLGDMTDAALFNILQYYLKERFSFVRTHIAPKGKVMDFADMVRAFAAERDRFTLSDVEGLADELDQKYLYLECICDRAVRVSQTEFVNKRLVHFDVAAIDAVLSDFCPGDYLPLHDVSSPMLMHLPSCGYPWTGYLMQSYLRDISKMFWLCYVRLGKNGYYGAMVRRSCADIDSYEALIERVLTDDDSWQTAADALELLVRRKYQAQRRLKGIERVVARAKQNKLTRDGR